jgi:hypothetical protein
LKRAPFVVSGGANFSMDSARPAGSIYMLWKMFDDKYQYFMEALRDPQLAPVWAHGYDMFIYVENAVLKVNGRDDDINAPYCWDWQSSMPFSPATRFVIFGWFHASGQMHLLDEPINVSMPSPVAGTVFGKGKK